MKRARDAVLLAALLAGLLLPAAAAAHGGVAVVERRDSKYNILLLASEPTDVEGPEVDLTAYLIGQRLGEPEEHAKVTVTVDRGGEQSTYGTELIADGYQALVPEPQSGAWRNWSFVVNVKGREGHSVARGGRVESRYSTPGWAVPAIAATVLAALALLAYQWRRNRRRPRPA